MTQQEQEIRVIIAAPQHLVVQGIAAELALAPCITVVSTQSTGRAALAALSGPRVVHVALLAIKLPEIGGLRILRRLNAAKSATKVVFVTEVVDPMVIQEVIMNGAAGVISTGTADVDLVQVVRHVLMPPPNLVLCQHMAGLWREAVLLGGKPAVALLAPRELQVLGLLERGATSKQIATRLSIATSTVAKHRGNMFRKLNVGNASAAIAAAARLGLLSDDD